ncbi:MAG: Crp/Fnr family transcriptional regulator [Anaerolineae bacterium]|nr:Crp/Fnr family transcriptional regulator [Anaerolineae bacterium]
MTQGRLQWFSATAPVAQAYENRRRLPMDTQELVRFLQAIPLLKGLTDHDLHILAMAAHRRVFQEGQRIYDQGEPGITCHLITRGRVKVFVASDEGHELAMRLLGPGELIGEMALFENLPRSASVVAVIPTETLELDQETLMRCLQRSPALSLSLLRAMSARLRHTTEEAEGLASLPVPERLLRRLQRLAEWSGTRVEDGIRIMPPMTQQELAALVGASRESINRALVKLRRQGVVRWDDGWIVLLDNAHDVLS